MSIVRIDPEGRRNAEHIAIIVVVDLVPIQSHFRSRRPQAQQPLYQDGPTATGPAQDGHRRSQDQLASGLAQYGKCQGDDQMGYGNGKGDGEMGKGKGVDAV